jgi:ribosomal protein S18 acetylase RimI-like enzyme
MAEIILFSIEHYHEAYTFWSHCPGVGLSSADSPDAARRFLERNPGMSFIALENGKLAGTICAGHDGRRGYLYHLAVAKEARRRGIGSALVDKSIEALTAAGIEKCHLFIFNDNASGIGFWKSRTWQLRTDISVMSYPPSA